MSSLTETRSNPYKFGTTFNYANWPAETEITLVNVPWNSDYRDVWETDNDTELDDYIDSLENSAIKLSGLSYVKRGVPIRLDIPFDVAMRYNYLRASNPTLPTTSPNGAQGAMSFYYFITDVKYISGNTTEVSVQLDIWQSFKRDVTLGQCFIERGHVGIANENNFDSFGRDFLTQAEGFDLGNEYEQIHHVNRTIMTGASLDIIVVSTVDFVTSGGSTSAPVLNAAKGSQVQNVPSGASVYVFKELEHFTNFMKWWSPLPWVTQGIVSITAVPDVSSYGIELDTVTEFTLPPEFGSFAMYTFKKASDQAKAAGGKYYNLMDNWRESSSITDSIPERWRHLKKFFTFPYMVLELTTWGATPIVLKPENWASSNARISEKPVFMPPNQRVTVIPTRYNTKIDSPIERVKDDVLTYDNTETITAGYHYYDDGGEYLDKATIVTNFPTLPIVNNMGLSYLASNNSSIGFSEQSADWSQQKALASAQTGYDQQSAAIQTSKDMAAMSRAGMGATTANNQLALMEQTAASGIASALGGAVGTGVSRAGGAGSTLPLVGGVISQVMGGVSAGISVDQSNRNLNTAQNMSTVQNTLETNQSALMQDTNKTLADWAAKGDYANAIAGINAKVQDAAMIQPSMVGQMGGDTFNLVHSSSEVSLRFKLISKSAMRVIGDYWLRFGYTVNVFSNIPTLKVMSKFSYWKLSQTYISAAPMPEYFKQAIRGIFEKGVTVWSHPSYIGSTDLADNEPISGVTL